MSPTVVNARNAQRRPAPSRRRDRRMWIGIALVLAGMAGLAAQAIVPPSELARKGIRTFGEVLFKDSKPADDGTFTYTVTFVFADATQRNHQVTRVILDKARWDRLKTRQEVRVVYLPGAPDQASIEGAEGLARPRSGAYAYLSWSAILLGAVLIAVAVRSASATPPTDTGHIPHADQGAPAP